MLAAAITGGLLGGAIFAFAHWQRYDRDRSFYPTVLVVIASYYVLFAVTGGDMRALPAQLAVALGFAVFAVFAGRRGNRTVAIGIVLHGLYDLAFQAFGVGGGVPPWWPMFCGAIDVVLGMAAFLAVARKDGRGSLEKP